MAALVLQKHQYRPVETKEEDLDRESLYLQSEIETRWRSRFHILLFSSLSCIALLITGLIHQVRTCPSPLSTPNVKVPYCTYLYFKILHQFTNPSTAPAPVAYVNKWLKGDPTTPQFVGQPRPEMDQAWHDLLAGTSIKLSEDELLLAGNATSIGHKDGGYIGGLGISHSLHCVVSSLPGFPACFLLAGSFLCFRRDLLSITTQKRIKQYFHPEYYYPGEQAWDELFMHVDHCLESLRQVVMCSADVSVYTLQWTPHNRHKPAVKVPQPHACTDWEALHEWMLGRSASLSDAVGPPEILYDDVRASVGHHGDHEGQD